MLSIVNLIEIVRLGGGVSFSIEDISVYRTKELIRFANLSGAIIIIRNANLLSQRDLKAILKIAPGQVILEF